MAGGGGGGGGGGVGGGWEGALHRLEKPIDISHKQSTATIKAYVKA